MIRATIQILAVTASAALWVACAAPAAAQDHAAHSDGGHEHGGHDHTLEIGLSPGLVYLPSDAEVAFGLHLHVLAAVTDTPFGVGLGAERLFDDHGHTTLSAVLHTHIVAGLGVAFSPGVTFEDGEWDAPRWNMHVEAAYELHFGAFHVGPALAVAIDFEEVHLAAGLHLAVGF